MSPGQSLSSLTAKILNGLETYFQTRRPDIVLGHGDTTTCFATALSSFYHKIPFLHVEAGLRTYKLDTPFPEEFNRQSVAPLASHHFAPTECERQNLLNDGIKESSITVIGSTVHEAVELIRQRSNNMQSFPFELPSGKKIVTVTLHRREGLNSLTQTLRGIRLAAQTSPDTLFICPVHPNPIVQASFNECLSGLNNIQLVAPLSYPSFINLLLRTDLILTDSGGVQEEGSFLGKRVLIARSETERLDGIKEGLVSLIGTDSDQIFENLNHHINLAPLNNLSMKAPQRAATDIISDYIEQVAI
jgi:UDP-N-acetylglucosamine 2-epimerase (non-hydrolysing)